MKRVIAYLLICMGALSANAQNDTIMNLTEIARNFLRTINEREATKQYDFNRVVCYDDLFDMLPHLHRKDSMHLYGYCMSEGMGDRTHLVWNATEPTAEYINQNSISWRLRDGIDMEACPEAVWEEWLMENVYRWLPIFWHARYSVIDLILSPEQLPRLSDYATGMRDPDDKIPPRTLLEVMDGISLEPHIESGDNGDLTLVFFYWTEWGGMYRQCICFHFDQMGAMHWLGSPSTCVYEFQSGLRY